MLMQKIRFLYQLITGIHNLLRMLYLFLAPVEVKLKYAIDPVAVLRKVPFCVARFQQ